MQFQWVFNLRAALTWLVAANLTFCSHAPESSDVLTEVKNLGSEEAIGQSKVSPAYDKLITLLKELGYEGIGLQYETDTTLELLFQVFSDSKASNRQLRLVYTGLQMSYDAQAQSLTVGGSQDPKSIVSFIQQNIPLNR